MYEYSFDPSSEVSIELEPLPDSYPAALTQLGRHMIQCDPRKRPTLDRVAEELRRTKATPVSATTSAEEIVYLRRELSDATARCAELESKVEEQGAEIHRLLAVHGSDRPMDCESLSFTHADWVGTVDAIRQSSYGGGQVVQRLTHEDATSPRGMAGRVAVAMSHIQHAYGRDTGGVAFHGSEVARHACLFLLGERGGPSRRGSSSLDALIPALDRHEDSVSRVAREALQRLHTQSLSGDGAREAVVAEASFVVGKVVLQRLRVVFGAAHPALVELGRRLHVVNDGAALDLDGAEALVRDMRVTADTLHSELRFFGRLVGGSARQQLPVVATPTSAVSTEDGPSEEGFTSEGATDPSPDGGAVDVVREGVETGSSGERTPGSWWGAIWRAAKDGDATKIREVLEHDPGLANATLPLSGVTPAFVAATFGHVAALRVLDEFGADVSAEAAGGVNLATTALRHGHDAVHACLRELGAPVEETSLRGLKAAMLKSARGDEGAQWTGVQAVQVLFDLGMFKDGVVDGWLYEDGIEGTSVPLLHYVAKHNGVEALPWWVACGGRLDVVDGNGRSAVHAAAQGDHAAMVRKLHAFGLDVGAVDAAGDSAAHVAGRHGCPRVLRVLQELGADVDLRNGVGRTPAFCAAWNGQSHVLGALKELGCDLEVRVGRAELTPMYVAAQRDHTAVVAELLELGVAGDNACALDATPADMARHRKSDGTLEVLRAHDIAPTCEEGMLPFVSKAFEAARVGDVGTLSLALDLGVELVDVGTCLARNNEGQSLAFVGSVNGQGSVLVRLSEVGVLNTLRRYCSLRTNGTLASAVVEAGKVDVLRVLHELCGVDALVQGRGGDGSTPAHVAAGAGKADVLRVLHELCGADALVQGREGDGSTPAHVAAWAGKADVLRVLHELCGAGALVQGRASDGSTPAHAAAGAGKADVLRVLHELGGRAALTTRDRYGRTPYAYTRDGTTQRVFQELGIYK